MKAHSDLIERPDLAPLAPAVGPFPETDFLRAWLEELGGGVEPLTIDWDEGQLALMRTGARLELMGEPDLTDYHSPLGEGLDEAVSFLCEEVGTGIELVLDSLPAEAATPLMTALENSGLRPTSTVHETAMVLALPTGVDEFYQSLSKKERHELRRKRRRYEELIGPVAHHRGNGFEEFVQLLRSAPGRKGQFLDSRRRDFFSRLSAMAGWRVDYLTTPAGKAIASVFGWSDQDGYYLYNSSYDPAMQAASPGLVLLQSLIEKSIGEGLSIFDFLKGEEAYKARLGAKARPLYRLEASI